MLIFSTMRQPVDDDVGDQIRPWSDLPPELLSLIAMRLGVIELLGFRGVCKGWRSASSTASAEIESAIGNAPSFLVFSDKDGKGALYYRPSGKMYCTINIPELEEATCLASNQGWLLLFQRGSLFFFCPFSRARIDLPQFPDNELSNHVAAFSAPPTSPQCIISVANRCDNLKVELYVLRGGATVWTKHERNIHGNELGTISAALYSEEKSSFYFLDSNRKVMKFSVKEEKWTSYRIMRKGEDSTCDETLPFVHDVNYFSRSGLRTLMGLQDVSISICGTILSRSYTYCINNEKLEALNGNANSQLKGIWIQARFHQVLPNQG